MSFSRMAYRRGPAKMSVAGGFFSETNAGLDG
jgi:hypothetical protein